MDMPGRLSRWPALLLLALVLAACGGGSSPGSAPAPQGDPPQAGTLAVSVPTGRSGDPVITGYELVWSQRVSRTVFDYAYRVHLQVGSTQYPPGTALIAASSSATTVLQKGNVITGILRAGDVATPADLFIIRQDRTAPFSASSLTWNIGVPNPAESGLRGMQSNSKQRSYYLDLPSDYDPYADPRPLIIAYHGTGGSYQAWLDNYRLKEQAVGDGAILVYPNALPNGAGVNQWDFTDDFRMFEDLFEQLPTVVTYDPDRVFITGHSSGGGFAHELGCRYGSRIRAIAPVAGSLTATSCTGAVAVIQIQGEKDSLVPLAIAQLGRRFWVLYNGFNTSMNVPGIEVPCVNYALTLSDYPVQWCQHQEGDGVTAHAWPTFASRVIWEFFQGLTSVPVPHADPPPNGGNDKPLAGTDTTLTVRLRYPTGMPTPVKLAVVLGPAGTRQPLSGAPLAFLNLNVAPGAVAGDERSYSIPVTYRGGDVAFPGSYTLEIVVYCEGGGFPIPAAGIDHVALADVELVDRTTPIVIPGVLELEPSQSAF
ncbi:MAG: hypothetical protein ABI567_08765 [Gammaproteobacteria bacterium]